MLVGSQVTDMKINTDTLLKENKLSLKQCCETTVSRFCETKLIFFILWETIIFCSTCIHHVSYQNFSCQRLVKTVETANLFDSWCNSLEYVILVFVETKDIIQINLRSETSAKNFSASRNWAHTYLKFSLTSILYLTTAEGWILII